ncbi:MAG: hypothetical protein WC901_07285 [Candidatus Margulisiibacteriota bacterium]
MAKLLDLLRSKPLTLIVSLPETSLEFAQAAAGGGADALNLDCDSFGTYLKDKIVIGQIVKTISVPCGITFESSQGLNSAEIKKLAAAGVDFIGMPIGSVVAALAKEAKIAEVYVLGKDYTIDELMNIGKSTKMILSAAVIRNFDLGRELNVGDLQNYIGMATSTDIPIIVPTQKKIHFSEVSILSDTGVKGLELTAQVLGKTLKTMQKAIREFRLAVDDLGEE